MSNQDAADAPASKGKNTIWLWIAALFVLFFVYSKLSGGTQVVLDERVQLNKSRTSTVYTLTAEAGKFDISITSDGPLDWALLPSQADFTFPHGPYNYVAPFVSIGKLRASHSGKLKDGVYYLEVNADSYAKPVTFDIKITRN